VARCEYLPKCIFFNDQMAIMPGTAELTKNEYCKSDFKSCARYQVLRACGREAVPADLYPAQTSRAREILSRQGQPS
jgi:hypothetical protein